MSELIKYWESKGWVEERTLNWWYRYSRVIKEGETVQEWKWNGKNNKGRKPFATVEEVKSYVESTGFAKSIETKQVVNELEKIQQKKDEEEGFYHITQQLSKRTK